MRLDDLRIAVVVAHPDDETLGLGGLMLLPLDITFLCVTDGAPFNMSDAHKAGFPDRESYARARREELNHALSLTNLPKIRVRHLEIPDQQAAFQLHRVRALLDEHLSDISPHLVFTHPFEGGHPDHDATAYAVHHAKISAAVIEFTSYHLRDGQLVHGEFLFTGDGEIVCLKLGPRALALKRRMIECFTSQLDFILGLFDGEEHFRVAPAYDFRCRPHAGPLFYETWDSGMTWDRWLECVERTHLPSTAA